MTDTQKEAVRLLGSMTQGRFDTWSLAGPQFRGIRSMMLSKLRNGAKVTQAQAGLTVLRAEFLALMGEVGFTCRNDHEEQFTEWARAQF